MLHVFELRLWCLDVFGRKVCVEALQIVIFTYSGRCLGKGLVPCRICPCWSNLQQLSLIEACLSLLLSITAIIVSGLRMSLTC